ncbi:glutaredoxin 3 [Pseudomonas saudimassiliensis]|uniref:Glutaredoxin n=1 Tax=Pseudomonas saudimassiliensis TaxID=1461581 RepID=A0A078MD43_9PSED|nr:glutaredoxin 3 [Pseudomonas saudimassiliensis]CEA04124.1 glutaredoxin 3 [Pseudomonas saudimassiliensis]CEF26433.1 glutaredoxin 3 [Pseudomonas saudimassiliensis]
MTEITLYSSNYCPFCIRAKQLLDGKGISYNEIRVDGKPEVRAEMARLAGRTSVPQIWIGDTHVGGCDDLIALERSGKLDTMLAG